MPQLSVVVPVYKAEHTLVPLYERLVAALEPAWPDFELLLVEDAGGDRSWAVIEELAARDGRVRGIKLSTNFGQHAATICGIGAARGTWIVTMDCDLEHPPEAIPALVAKALEGYDLVYGVFHARTHAAWRNLTSGLARMLFNLAIPSLNGEYTSFRVVNARVARVITQFSSPFPFVDGYLSWVTNKYATVPVAHERKPEGRSTYTFRKLLTHTINLFVTFSDLPLRLASWLGLLVFFGGLAATAVIVWGRLSGAITVSGYASIMAGLFSFGGLQLLVLGILGEYIARINFKTTQKPLFVIGEETAGPQPVPALKERA